MEILEDLEKAYIHRHRASHCKTKKYKAGHRGLCLQTKPLDRNLWGAGLGGPVYVGAGACIRSDVTAVVREGTGKEDTVEREEQATSATRRGQPRPCGHQGCARTGPCGLPLASPTEAHTG